MADMRFVDMAQLVGCCHIADDLGTASYALERLCLWLHRQNGFLGADGTFRFGFKAAMTLWGLSDRVSKGTLRVLEESGWLECVSRQGRGGTRRWRLNEEKFAEAAARQDAPKELLTWANK